MPVFDPARQVGVAGSGIGERLFARLAAGLGRHDLGPVAVVLVLDDQRDGCARRAPGPHPAEKLRLVGLDHHAAAPPVAALPLAEPGIDVAPPQRQLRGQPFDDGRQLRPVRLPGGQIPHAGTVALGSERRRGAAQTARSGRAEEKRRLEAGPIGAEGEGEVSGRRCP